METSRKAREAAKDGKSRNRSDKEELRNRPCKEDILNRNVKRKKQDYIREAVESIAVSALLAWLCFDSIYGLFSLLPVIVLNHLRHQKDAREAFDEEFRKQYRELLMSLVAGLQGGISVEKSFLSAEKEMTTLYGKECLLLEELHRLNTNVALSMPVENAFFDFAKVYPYEEVEDFASIFSFAKRLGANYTTNIRRTAAALGEDLELKQEISAITAEKRMELKIMCMMPLGILFYIRMGSPDYLETLYHNPAGVLVMILALGLYAASLGLGRFILRKGGAG